MKRMRYLALLITTAALSLSFTAHAQRGDMQHFAEFEGLDRVIARSWLAPMALPGDTGTPVSSTPAATPLATPVTGPVIQNLSVFVYLFDSDENAAAGFERIDDDLAETRESDASAPMEDELPLDGVGDRANGYTGEMAQGDHTLTFTFATVQDGPFVYSLSGVFAGAGDDGLTRAFVESLVRAPMDRMAEQYDPAGGSRGGLWSKLNAVEPMMPEGSTVTDFEIYPMPETTSRPAGMR